jgi:polar amino acid transport system substrate-binding protein
MEIVMTGLRRTILAPTAIALALLAACASVALAPIPEGRQALAPTGKFRVGLYPGTPTSIMGDPASGTARGVGFDLGRELARRAGVPFEPVVYAKNAEVLAAVKSGAVHMAFTNATTTRMKDADFSPTVLQVEQGYLVPRGSTILLLTDVDRPGVRVGVSEGSTSEVTLSREFANAAVVRTPSLKAAIEMLAAGKLDAFATNKATLFELSDELPGSSVLGGRWGLENFAIAIPKGREPAMTYVAAFVADAKAEGLVTRAIERAGLRGTVRVAD